MNDGNDGANKNKAGTRVALDDNPILPNLYQIGP